MASGRVRPVAWDPKNPTCLLLPTVDSSGDSTTSRVDTLFSHDGVGCNSHEASALMNLLDAHETYMSGRNRSWASLKALSTAYRHALFECLKGWDENLANDTNMDSEASLEVAKESNELLKAAYAVTHLSEIYLLLPPSDSTFHYIEGTAFVPGAVTADLVRYLRYHHMPNVLTSVEPDSEVLDEVLQSIHPDQLGENGDIYWKLVETFLLRGSLEEAWALLSRHSLFRRATDSSIEMLDEYHASTLAQDKEGFFALRALLLSAPLPGGRDESLDAALDLPSNDDFDAGIQHEELLDGVPMSGFLVWESGRMVSNEGSGDYPGSFNPTAADQRYQAWRRHLQSLPAIDKLKRRVPKLDMVLSILKGDFKDVQFDSWAEMLCAELLYKQPSMRPDDISSRAAAIMAQFDDSTSTGMDEVVLSVMKGNAGRVVEAMHDLGGGSGAALPAVMTAFLCHLLLEAGCIPETVESLSLRTELLLNASFAIRSSHAANGHHDQGVKLSIRLLLPYATPGGDLRITATIGEILEHHTPQSDAEARTLLSLCRKLVKQNSVRVLDGCVSVALTRYRHYLADQRPGGAIHWLVTGMELESTVLSSATASPSWQRNLSCGVCYRVLATSCMETAQSLLKGLLGEGENTALVFTRAQEMVKAEEESRLVALVPAMKVLSHVVGMAEATAKKKDESIIAANIISCLEEIPNEEDDGVVSSISRTSMHWDLLRLAHRVLESNLKREDFDTRQSSCASFDVSGMRVLLERFTVVMSSREMERLHPIPSEDIHNMRLALGNGLMRAFVAENSNKSKNGMGSTKATSVAGICAADLANHSRDRQEKVVELMLDI